MLIETDQYRSYSSFTPSGRLDRNQTEDFLHGWSPSRWYISVLPARLRTFSCSLPGDISFLILINHRKGLKWKQTECSAHQGLWQDTICLYRKTRLRWHHHQAVMKRSVVHLTDWNHETRTEGAGDDVHLVKCSNDKYKGILCGRGECFSLLKLQRQPSLKSPGSNHGGTFLFCFGLLSNSDVQRD